MRRLHLYSYLIEHELQNGDGFTIGLNCRTKVSQYGRGVYRAEGGKLKNHAPLSYSVLTLSVYFGKMIYNLDIRLKQTK